MAEWTLNDVERLTALNEADQTFQMTEVAVPEQMFADILWLIALLRASPAPA